MFKEKIREIFELVMKAEDQTGTYVSYSYDSKTKVLAVIVDEEVFTMSDNKYLYLSFGQCRDCLKELIEKGERYDG